MKNDSIPAEPKLQRMEQDPADAVQTDREQAMNPEEHALQAYRFDLPKELIARYPLERRDESRLLHLDRKTGAIDHLRFRNIEGRLDPGTLLVVNNSKVLPGRLVGRRSTGGKVEFLLLTPLPLLQKRGGDQEGWMQAVAQGLTKSSKRLQPGETVTFGEDFEMRYEERGDFGKCRVTLRWRENLEHLFMVYGETPLPPYIDRPAEDVDCERYQTIYCDAAKAGSVAAPTAGLHFSHGVMERLEGRGVEWTAVTLYVGYGTFSPVRTTDIRDHDMHAEYYEVSSETAAAIQAAKAEGRPVIGVGTTAVRVLEGVYAEHGEVCPCSGWTNIFLYPGKSFHVVDGMLTNFHLPESSLLMLVSAFAGRTNILEAYREAVALKYRFFSYGDAMLIL